MLKQQSDASQPGAVGDLPPVGVFLGLYGTDWIDNAIASVERQSVDRLQVVAAVNGPRPKIEDRLSTWILKSRHAITVVENERNLGPIGSWYQNAGLLKTPWVAIFHQDDHYLADHIPTAIEAVSASDADILAIFTGVGGIDASDMRSAAPPLMLNRHIDSAPSSQLLPEVLRRHPVATPTAVLRNPQGLVDHLAWYDSGAPDSEWFAHLACRGRFRILPRQTVLYRRGAESESSSTAWASRAWQWAASLDRLIQSADFGELLSRVPVSDREGFAKAMLESIPARYPTSPLFTFLAFAAAQRMADAWIYESRVCTDYLISILASDPGSAAVRNLASIAEIPDIAILSTNCDVDALLGSQPRRGSVERSARAAYNRFGHLLPASSREAAFRIYDRFWPHRGAR